MSELAPLCGLLFKSTDRVRVEDEDLFGWVRIGGEEYRVSAFKQRTRGRWSLKLTPVATHSGKAAQALEQSEERSS